MSLTLRCSLSSIGTSALRSRWYFTLLLALSVSLGHAQQFNITQGSATSCAGVIEDSGGPSGEYGNNENFTFTICPDVPGNVVYLTWFVFDLNTDGPAPLDRLNIYDGDNTSATHLGSYTGTSLQNLIVSGTVFNTTGCLTLVFQSNGSGTGNFAAGFQCTVPCSNPTASATMSETAPALICQGETLTFDGSASTAQGTNSIVQYLWDFGDGTLDSTSGPIVSHTFLTSGERVVQLYVFDDNDCRNLNLVDLQVLVSTTPTFNLTSESVETCFGSTVTLTGGATATTWTGIPDANFGDGIALPDDVGIPFTSVLTFEQFNTGQLVTSVSDILSICVEMEHSFMGDLVLQVICPNGQSTILHQQQGGGTYLGAANDTDNGQNPVIGECWEYCWSATATLGTWAQSVQAGGNFTTAGTPPNNSLTPGTYSSVQPLSNLIGCPLNGDWTYQSTDLWGADNGFICSWSLNFNPAIIPDVTTFTPTFGADADSSLWTGGTAPDQISANGDTISFTATEPGVFNFLYQVTDNFGCSYDTTITVTVAEPFFVNAGPDQVICNDPVQLDATQVGAATSCVWTLQMLDSWGDGWNGASITVNNNGVTTTHSCQGSQTSATFNVVAGTTITLSYSSGSWDNEVSYNWRDDQGNIIHQAGPNPPTGLVWTGIASCDGSQGMEWSWSPAAGLSNPTIANPTALVTSTTSYVVTGHLTGYPECFATDTVVVSVDPALDPGSDSSIVVCAYPPVFLLTDMLAGTPQTGGVWTNAAGTVVPSTFDPETGVAGTYTYTVTTPAGCVGTAELAIEILAANDPLCCGLVDAGPDSTICELTFDLNASIGNTNVGVWTGPPGYVFADPYDPQTSVTAPGSGTAMFYWTEDNGACFLQDSLTIVFTEPLAATITVTDAICLYNCDGTATVSTTGGNGAFTYGWSNSIANDTLFAEEICAGSYSVNVTDVNGCTTTASFTVTEPALLEIDGVSFVEPTCFAGCDGSITINDAQAVEYSFDGGNSFSSSPTLTNVCSGNYDLQIRNALGCLGTDTVFVSQPLQVVAAFDHMPIPANVNDPRITFINQSENATLYNWDIAGLLSTTEANPTFVFDNKEPGMYDVCLTVADNVGCTDTICQLITIEDVLFTYVANTFTPNADGINDVWGMSSNIADIKDFTMEVFDRWGQIVFASEDPYEMWNGSYKNGGGNVLKDGMYAYRIRFRLITTGGAREIIGHVTLLK